MSTKLKKEFTYIICMTFAIFGLFLCRSNFQDIHFVGSKTINRVTVIQNRFGKVTAYEGQTSDNHKVELTKKDYQAWENSSNLSITRNIYHRADDRLAVKALKVDWQLLPLFLGGSLLIIISYSIRLILKCLIYFRLGNSAVMQHLIRVDLMMTTIILVIGVTHWSYTNYLEPSAFDHFQSETRTVPTTAKVIARKQTTSRSVTSHGTFSTTTNKLTFRFQNDLGVTQRVVREVPRNFYHHKAIQDSLIILPYSDNSGWIRISSISFIFPNSFQCLILFLNFTLIWVLPQILINFWITLTHLNNKKIYLKTFKKPMISSLLILSLFICATGQGYFRAHTVNPSASIYITQKVRKM